MRCELAHPYVCEAGHCPPNGNPRALSEPSRRHLPGPRRRSIFKATPIDAAQ
jgi:hypothetical protein